MDGDRAPGPLVLSWPVSCDARATETYVTLGGCTRVAISRGMPRKQRFKPSRKPQPQATVSNPPQVDDRKEIRRPGPDVERQAPAEPGPGDIETEQA